ncbi:DUF4105 domain-containing protein [Coralloluteibacterium thermophilus]|uniref:DUF4105 domain-containing protein n=1 Tax=Coralloluteibacterium thermophilum TaxID=2707049 RepID=A0ABV9NHM5_9GAMM
MRAASLRALLAALLLLACCASAAAQAPRIGVVTMAPGTEYWSRFGHNAVIVDDPAQPEPVMYNYGFFDFEAPGFLPNFLRGKMAYLLVALPAREDLARYDHEGRGAVVQWLDVAPEAARELADFLEWNARPENATYRYDYFTDNCSTRVRDAVDRALDGALRRQLDTRSRGLTYRSEALRLGQPTLWLALGMHFGLGPHADRPLSRWDEAFVPSRLAESLREVRGASGGPLVVAETEILPHRIAPEPAQEPRWVWRFFGLGLAAAVALLLLATRTPRAVATVAAGYWTLTGLAGVGLASLWLFTDHVAGWANENLLLASPLALALVPGALALARGRRPGRAFLVLLHLVTLLAATAGFLKLLPFRIQDNLDWVALLLPVQIALLIVASRRPR